ncbi:MAG: 30S ribosomal protein S2, partial [Nitrospinota bacterium]
FVGTKKQAQTPVEEEARRCGMPYVTKRWLGGTLTNFATIKIRVNRLKELQQLDNEDGAASRLIQGKTKKEILRLSRERERLEKYFKGIQDMDRLPKALFIVDPNRESIAVREARKLGVPVIAVVDTNCDPDGVDYVLPGNDDAIRAIRLFSSAVADAILEGRAMKKDEATPDVEAQLKAAQAESSAKAEPAPTGETKAGPPAEAKPQPSEPAAQAAQPAKSAESAKE